MEYLPDVTSPRRDADMVLISIVTCLQGNYAQNRQNKCLLGLLLSIRHISMSTTGPTGTFLSSAMNRYASGYGPNQRMNLGRTSSPHTYNRIATFADLKSDGKCFAVILKTSAESNTFFKHCLPGQLGVGCVFLLEEPSIVLSYLGSTSSVPVFEGCSRLLPLSRPYPQYIPTVTLTVPESGCTAYFSMHNAEVTIGMAMFQNSICGGEFCDRQVNPGTPMQRCGCFHGDRGTQMTIRCDVNIPVPPQYNIDRTYLVSDVRSWRTAQLFVRDESWQSVQPGDWDQQKLLRDQVEIICDIVNNNGGWCVVGWLRTGIVQDTSNASTIPGQPDNLASINMFPHISYLFPSDPAAVFAAPNYSINKLDLASNDDAPVANVNADIMVEEETEAPAGGEEPEVPADDFNGGVEEQKHTESEEEKDATPEEQEQVPADDRNGNGEEDKNKSDDEAQAAVNDGTGGKEVNLSNTEKNMEKKDS